MDFITSLLAKLFSTFKAKNPKAAAAIILALLSVVYFAQQGTFLGVFVLPEWSAGPLQWIANILVALQGSETWQYLQSDNKR